MSNPHNLQPGQQLWLVSKNNARTSMFVTIEKVGRLYSQIRNRRGRIDNESLHVDDAGCSVGICYLDKEQYEAEAKLQSEWSRLGNHVRDACYLKPPAGMTLEKIAKAREIIGLPAMKEAP